LEDVALKMNVVNVKIQIRNEGLKKERYRGKFVTTKPFTGLEAIKYTTPINYSIKNNEIIIDKLNQIKICSL
jgi:hypothetical protein